MADNRPRLFLLDAYALIYRAYYAFIRNPITNSKGVNTSAAYGFTATLNDLIEREKPTHLAVVFDAEGETDRASEFAYYKANRDAMPEDIRNSLQSIRDIIQGFNIPILELPGYEADDVIGTLAKQKEGEFDVFMVTPDKDFGQLVSENIFMYKPSRQGKGHEVLGIPEVCARWEINDPLQVIDILAMMGDAVDNIPGITGVGEKTAIKLLKQFGSLEALLENTDQVKGKLREKIENCHQQALDSKFLATIITDAPITANNDALKLEPVNKEALTPIFQELEFRNLAMKILGSEYSMVSSPSKKTGNPNQMDLFSSNQAAEENTIQRQAFSENYSLLKDEDIPSLITSIQAKKQFAFDTETTGLNVREAEIVGISFAWDKGYGAYYPLSEQAEEAKKQLAQFAILFQDTSLIKVAQNIKFDTHILSRYGMEVVPPFKDTMLEHYLLEPDRRHGINRLSEAYLQYAMQPIEELIGKKGKHQKTFREVELSAAKDYAVEDADIALQLHEVFSPKLASAELTSLYDSVELPLVPVLRRMEGEGINLDTDFLAQYSTELTSDILEVKTNIFNQAGQEFNLDSPKQLGEILFGSMGIPYKGQKTKTGQFKTGEDVLSSYRKDYPVMEDIMTYRELSKLKSTYVDALPQLVSAKTGRIHTTFNQAVAATGRLSSNEPNLQNIPIRTERGRRVRQAFIPRDANHWLLSADYSQVELRLVAHMAKEESMLDAFAQGKDIHSETAALVFQVPVSEVTREMRSHAKTVNFGIIYGVTAFGLSQQTSLSRSESKEIIEQYFVAYPGIRKYMDDNVAFAREHGYVKTLKGRRRYLRDIDSRNAGLRGHAERNAINAPVQGSAADLIKLAMIDIDRLLMERKLQSKMLLQVHDELVFDVPSAEREEVEELVKEAMQNAMPGLDVPLQADLGWGRHWLEAH